MKIINIINTLSLLKKINVTRKDIVLEIGSGANPFIRSDVLLDKFPCVNKDHRPGKSVIQKDERPFVVGDVQYLPFPDKSFDLVIARHVLEHLQDVDLFISEIKRVSKSILITTPSPFIEILHGGYQQKIENKSYKLLEHGGKGTPGHKWFVSAINNKIFMIAKTPHFYPLYLMLGKHIKNNTKYSKDRFFKANPEWLETVFICDSDNAEIEILHGLEDKIEESFDPAKLISCLECIETNIGIKSTIKSMVRKLCLSTKKNLSIYDLLVCPICKKELLKGNNELVCAKCGAYPIINNIPVMMQM